MTNSNLTPKTALRFSLKTVRQAIQSASRSVTTAAFVFLFLSGAIVSSVKANGTYYNFTSGNLTLNITPATVDLIKGKSGWSNIPSVEGYCGKGLTTTHGVNPQTILTSENTALPDTAQTCINPDNGNPSAFNAGGIAEFDHNEYLAIGFQGNVQANPYLVFYLNTVGQTYLRIGYDLIDIDSGSNDSVSPIALQYRIGETGNFTNLPAGFVADVTDKGVAGRKTTRSVVMPADALGQSKLQIRLITTDAAGSDGDSSPDEWIGINNVVVSNLGVTAADAAVGGRVFNPSRKPLADAAVFMYDNTGGVRATRTDSNGFYRFDGVTAGETYVFEVRSKKYVFPQPVQLLSVTEDYASLDFYAAPVPRFGDLALRFK